MADKKLTHPALVKALMKRGEDIEYSMTPHKLEVWHMGTGIAGEAGELLDAIKKHVVYEQKIDFENVLEELGDLEFFMEGLRQLLGISREACLHYNVEKLTKRYRELTYSNQAAKERLDKFREQQQTLPDSPHSVE